MTQPEALRLAAELEACPTINYKAHAAELRRLHAENEALQNVKHYEAPRGFVLNPDYLVPELRAQRDALLEALKLAEAALADIGDADREPGDDVAWCEARAAEAIPQVRAAIAKAEGEKA